jgi:hypothetical protein
MNGRGDLKVVEVLPHNAASKIMLELVREMFL